MGIVWSCNGKSASVAAFLDIVTFFYSFLLVYDLEPLALPWRPSDTALLSLLKVADIRLPQCAGKQLGVKLIW